MAANDPVVQILRVMPPGASAATMAGIAGGSTPAENVRVWSFVDTASRYVDFLCALRRYGGGGVSIQVVWSAAAVVTGSAVWQASVRAFPDDTEQLSAAHTYTFATVTGAAPSLLTEVSYDTIALSGASLDGWANEQLGIVRIFRNPAHASDNLNDTAHLWGFRGFETA